MMDEEDRLDHRDVDELAIDVSRDYCETCGKFTDGETCVACGDAPENRSGDSA